MTTTDHRLAARDRVLGIIAALEAAADAALAPLIDECRALARAIEAFHMEGIRFRMFNVDRAINRGTVNISDEARAAFADVRRHLEAAGFHTRSHQAPT